MIAIKGEYILMPLISQFFGIMIYMYWDEHNPPHFHAKYNEFEAEISLLPIKIIKGDMPKRIRSLIFEWTAEHHEELLENWELSKANKELNRIKSLE
jgi:hypothetical protein